MKPLVSIIIPAYNSEKYIAQAIDSALSQTYQNIEVLVINDGSVDRTEIIAKDHGSSRIRYFKKSNGGPASARNFGIKESRGDFLAFLDSDDIFLPEKIERQMELILSSASTDMVTCNGYYITETGVDEGRFIQGECRNKKKLIDDLILKRGVCTNFSTILVRKEALFVVGLIDKKLIIGEDRKLWLALAQKYEICSANEFLIKYRRRSDSISAVKNDLVVFKNNQLFLSDIFAQKQFKRRLILKAKAYSYHYFYTAWVHNTLGSRKKAIFYIVKSLCFFPFKMPPSRRSALFVRIALGNKIFDRCYHLVKSHCEEK